MNPPGQSAGDISTVNGSIRVDDKAVIASAHTVNGRIILGTAVSAQSVSTVNGSVDLGDATSANSLRTVNGSISIGAGGRIAGAVTTVNGKIGLQHSADVAGHLASVNGSIRLDAAHVGAGIETTSGNIDIGADSRVEGGILVRHTRGALDWFFSWHHKPPKIVIGPGAIVQGTLTFESAVKLYVSDRARIGSIEGAKAIVYSGDRPPI